MYPYLFPLSIFLNLMNKQENSESAEDSVNSSSRNSGTMDVAPPIPVSNFSSLQAMDDDAESHGKKSNGSVKIALSLYKVQQSIYLLDFQRVEVRK